MKNKTPISLFEKEDFVYLAHDNKPYFVHRLESGKRWIFYWHEANKEWVTLREFPEGPSILAGRMLTRAEAELYFAR